MKQNITKQEKKKETTGSRAQKQTHTAIQYTPTALTF